MSRVTPTRRIDNFLLGLAGGLLFTIVFALGAAFGIEAGAVSEDPLNEDAGIFQWNWRKFDGAAFLSCAVGGAVGQAVQLIIAGIIAG